ncbi:MAG: DUF4291 family protein [Peptococcaceae bacterium]|nr:DUF4291 family protein [Peptococcaceae bacterium]
MAQDRNDIRLGRFISLVLRHNPSAAGIILDQNGWADVSELLAGMNKRGRHIDMETLERIVCENNKQRYSFDETHSKIRAVFDDTTIRVYQAYSDAIANAALENGVFVSPPYKIDRMTWIKPSFLWMMYRSGWGHKDAGQKRILAIDITRDGFEWALRITEITPLAHTIHKLVQTGDINQAQRLLPEEKPYPLQYDQF